MSIIQGNSKSSAAGYSIDQSIRFNADDSAYLTRTPGSEGNRRTFTLSTWVKFNEFRSDNIVFSSWISSGASNYALLYMHSDFRVRFEDQGGTRIKPSMVFRDPAAWYHIVLRVDTTDSTANDRYQMYVNGERQTDLNENIQPALNFETNINKTQPHYFGRNGYSLAMIYSDLYQAETHFIDGTALDASSFGETNADTGQWVPKKYTGSYGTNGFYLKGQDSSALGDDSSGNGNDFTSSGLAAADQVTDSPTDNFCTLSPIDGYGSKLTLSDGNLRAVPSAAAYCNNHGTIYVGSGKWVYEVKHTTVFGEAVGWSPLGERISGSSHRGWFMFSDGRAYINTTNQGTLGTSLSSGDYRYIFYDADNQAMWFAHCDVSSGTPTTLVYENSATKSEIESGDTTNAVFTGISAVDLAPGLWMDTSGVIETNFGQSAFYTTSDLPTGFNTLSTANLDDPTIADPSAYFQTTLYTGDGVGSSSGGQEINQSGNSTFQPDFVWIKCRSLGTESHNLQDVVRGADKRLQSNNSNAEGTETEGLLSFDSDGFTVGNRDPWNKNTATYVGWQWLADNTSGSSNTDGSITSTVSANTTSGFSISTYTGNATVGATVGHGLGVAPKVVIVKSRSNGESWVFGHDSMGWTKAMYLQSNGAPFTLDIYWNNTAPTSSVVELHDHPVTNGSGYTYVMYSFAEVEGFSKFGSYTGNGSTDGSFVYTGFKPAFVLWKQFTNLGTNNFIIRDSAREPYNVVDTVLFPNTTAADTTDLNGYGADLLSNGFKLRGNDGAVNKASSDYLYMAFAESPFKTATAR